MCGQPLTGVPATNDDQGFVSGHGFSRAERSVVIETGGAERTRIAPRTIPPGAPLLASFARKPALSSSKGGDFDFPQSSKCPIERLNSGRAALQRRVSKSKNARSLTVCRKIRVALGFWWRSASKPWPRSDTGIPVTRTLSC